VNRKSLSALARSAALVAFVVALGASAGARAATHSGAACGLAGAAHVVDAIDDGIAQQIYSEELKSAEVSADLARITSSTALASAVASGNLQQIRSATYAIVYTPVWHIVRLRVLSTSGQLLADVGGPDIIAPVSGQLTYDGRTVGSFVMSVQDDKGYKKLVNHITGAAVELYRAGKPLMGTLPHPPLSPPRDGPLRIGGRSYDVATYTVNAYPTGTLRVAVLVPVPSVALAALSCPEVKLATDTTIVKNIAVGLTVSGFDITRNLDLFIQQAYGYTHLPVFVFDGGAEIYGTDYLTPDGTPGAPASLTPKSTIVRYAGGTWLVSALRPFPPDWIYVLAPASSTATVTGATGPTGGSAPAAGAG
jgi:hypothetical protein